MFANLPTNEVWDGHMSWEDDAVESHIKYLIDECHWYTDDERYLYIVDFEASEVHGPDCPEKQEAVVDALWEYLKDHPEDGYGAAAFATKKCECEVGFVQVMLRSFSSYDGFYHR